MDILYENSDFEYNTESESLSDSDDNIENS